MIKAIILICIVAFALTFANEVENLEVAESANPYRRGGWGGGWGHHGKWGHHGGWHGHGGWGHGGGHHGRGHRWG
ncbi:hypothetical protein RN001_000273 [Aquatica leii]|uniref:Uncharacterized protein n=1 Tax=Aquatica leii TaxID=1421715 RepID=A0AAN7Q6Y1_9COLE|nr:hypothetical protein RN001_000273 [Aquatica leii]